MARAAETEILMFVLLRQHKRSLRSLWRKKDVSKAEEIQRRAYQQCTKETKIFFYLCIILSQSAVELHKSNTKSCSTSKSMENLQTAPSLPASVPGIPQLQPLRLQYMECTGVSTIHVTIWRNIALRGSNLRFMFFTKEHGLPGHKNLQNFYCADLKMNIFFYLWAWRLIIYVIVTVFTMCCSENLCCFLRCY